MNRVLTRDEVLALPDGARVWVNHSNDNYAENWDGIHTFFEHGGLLVGEDGSSWCCRANPGLYNNAFRVWSLPVAPTDDELAAWPWEA